MVCDGPVEGGMDDVDGVSRQADSSLSGGEMRDGDGGSGWRCSVRTEPRGGSGTALSSAATRESLAAPSWGVGFAQASVPGGCRTEPGIMSLFGHAHGSAVVAGGGLAADSGLTMGRICLGGANPDGLVALAESEPSRKDAGCEGIPLGDLHCLVGSVPSRSADAAFVPVPAGRGPLPTARDAVRGRGGVARAELPRCSPGPRPLASPGPAGTMFRRLVQMN